MIFKVKFRGSDGSMREECLEAASRAECVAECRRRGIAPVGIVEGGKRGRASTRAAGAGGDSMRTTARWAGIAAVIAVVVGGGVWWWSGRCGTSAPSEEEPGGGKSKPTSVRQFEGKEGPAPAKKSGTATDTAPHRGTRGTSKGIDSSTAEPQATNAQSAVEGVPPEPQPPSVFQSGTEQVLNMVFNCEVGALPAPLPRLSDVERKNIWNILKSRMEAKEDDSEATVDAKQMIDFAKKEMLEFIKQGGDPDDFLDFYHRELRKAHELREVFKRELENAVEERPEEAAAMYRKMNEKLSESGIKRLTLDQEDKERIGLAADE